MAQSTSPNTLHTGKWLRAAQCQSGCREFAPGVWRNTESTGEVDFRLDCANLAGRALHIHLLENSKTKTWNYFGANFTRPRLPYHTGAGIGNDFVHVPNKRCTDGLLPPCCLSLAICVISCWLENICLLRLLGRDNVPEQHWCLFATASLTSQTVSRSSSRQETKKQGIEIVMTSSLSVG